MTAARIDVLQRLRDLRDAADQAGNQPAASTFHSAAQLLEGALNRAEAHENMRDRYAMAALTGLLGGAYVIEHPLSLESEAAVHDAADLSYRIADAMMARRLKP